MNSQDTIQDLVEGLFKALELSKALYVDVEASERFDRILAEKLASGKLTPIGSIEE